MDEKVMLGHGSGGSMMKRIIDEVFYEAYGNDELLQGNDAAGSAGAQTWRAAGLLHRQLRRDPSVLPWWQHRAARDLRHGERCGHFRRPPALSELWFHP